MKPYPIKARSWRRVLAGPNPRSGTVAAPWLLIFFVATSASMSCNAQETTEPSAPTSSQIAEPRSEEQPATASPSNAEPSGAPTHFDDLAVQGLDRAVLDHQAIGRTLGVEAETTDDGVVRATWSRTEVPVTVDGMSFPAAAGLTSWAGFTSTEGGAMLMGDTVVFQDEVGAAMDAAFANGLEITALHNHFFYDEPKVYFLHIGGHGDASALARGVDAVWDAIREVRRQRPEPASTLAGEAPSPGGSIDAAAIGRIVGVEPTVNDEVVKVTIGHEAAMHGTRVSGSMGLTSWAAFTGSDELAAIDGDFAMTASEVQPVLRALRSAGIHVVALHNHMTGEEPAYFFTHFWAKGPAAELARGFRAAFDAQQEAGGNDGR